jgi:predicted amidophosphoribosyltransferase
VFDLSRLDVSPTGFGTCGQCPYRDTGSAALCFACASQTMTDVSDDRCMVCDQELRGDGTCINYWCRQPTEQRWFDVVWAIAMRTGELESAINRYKFNDKWGWALIFGRVLVGYLEEHRHAFSSFDRIIPSPTYTGPGGRRAWDHIQLILDYALAETDDSWPFEMGDPRAIVKIQDTPSMVGLGLWDRQAVAEKQLRDALRVPSPDLVRGKKILVFDDVFTEGSTLREVARALKRVGAVEVSGIVLARQPRTY